MEIRLDFGLILALYCLLFLFGTGYDKFVYWGERKGYIEGFMSIIVAVGVGVTVAVMAIVNWIFALIMLGGFVASGSPMIIGSIVRYVRKRRAEQDELRRSIK